MNITIDHLTAGAARARGVTVIIDVFRAYSFESYAFSSGAIHPSCWPESAMPAWPRASISATLRCR